MYSNAQIKPLLALVLDIASQSAADGCAPGFTVTSGHAVDAAAALAKSLEHGDGQLVIGQHDYRHDSSFYAFLALPGASFGQDDFKEYLGETFDPNREEFAYVRPFDEKDVVVLEPEAKPADVAVDFQPLEVFIDAATKHGEDSDPDHEVGDLQDYLRAMWSLLTPEQRLAFPGLSDVRNTLDGATGV